MSAGVGRRALLLGGAVALLPFPARAGAPRAYDRKVLRDPRGRATSLARAAAGKRLVVVTLKGTWCQVCMKQLERFEKLRADLEKRGARVVAISPEGPKKNAAAIKRHGLRIPILADPERHVLKQLGLWLEDADHPMPALVVFDRCGKERGRQVGRGPRTRPARGLMKFLRKLQDAPATCRQPSV